MQAAVRAGAQAVHWKRELDYL
eukprot:COSAG01_NODE_72255_length_253_cov_1.012987_1_plen_22_part_10